MLKVTKRETAGQRPKARRPNSQLGDLAATKAGRKWVGLSPSLQAGSKMVGVVASATPPPLPSTSLLLPQATQAGGGEWNGATHVIADNLARDAKRRAQHSPCLVGNVVKPTVKLATRGGPRTTFPRRQRDAAAATAVGERGRGARCRAGARFGPVVPLRGCSCDRCGGLR